MVRHAGIQGERLNVLLTDGDEPWSEHLPRLLEPQGVRAIRVDSVRQAIDVIDHEPIHMAVVDLALPVDQPESPAAGRPAESDRSGGGALKLVQVIRRLDPTPPTVIIRGRLFQPRLDDRLLREALTLNVFSVLDQPVQMEQVLRVLQRVMARYYDDVWPGQTEH